MVYWDVLSIATWNKSRFPQNTATMQRRKLAGEIDEFKQAVTRKDKLAELADCYIASAGLTRFGGSSGAIGAFICDVLERIDDTGELKNAVWYKMLENVERKFDKNMQHIPQI